MAVRSALIGLACCAALGAAELDEYGVKSAFVYNFLQFVDWPASKLPPAALLTICVLEDPPIARQLSALSDRTAKGHPIRVRSVTAPSDAEPCHVLFVSADDSGRLPELALRYRRAGLLLIGEGAGPEVSEAVINLVVSDNKVRFDVNLKAATEQDLKISSRLLQLARYVSGMPADGRGASGPGRSY